MGEKHLHYGAIYQVKLFQYSLIWNPLFHQYIRSWSNLFLALMSIFTVDILYFVSDRAKRHLPARDWYTWRLVLLQKTSWLKTKSIEQLTYQKLKLDSVKTHPSVLKLRIICSISLNFQYFKSMIISKTGLLNLRFRWQQSESYWRIMEHNFFFINIVRIWNSTNNACCEHTGMSRVRGAHESQLKEEKN